MALPSLSPPEAAKLAAPRPHRAPAGKYRVRNCLRFDKHPVIGLSILFSFALSPVLYRPLCCICRRLLKSHAGLYIFSRGVRFVTRTKKEAVCVAHPTDL